MHLVTAQSRDRGRRGGEANDAFEAEGQGLIMTADVCDDQGGEEGL